MWKLRVPPRPQLWALETSGNDDDSQELNVRFEQAIGKTHHPWFDGLSKKVAYKAIDAANLYMLAN